MTKIHKLAATVNTVKWGYYESNWESLLTVESGDIVEIEALNHQSGDAPDLLFDDAIQEIYDTITTRIGDHLITGPIYVKDAEPGDVLEVKILDMKPRMPYGSNVLANWGYLAEDFDQKESIVIYQVDEERQVASPLFTYEYPRPIDAPGLVTPKSTVERKAIEEQIDIPINYHFGVCGVLPKDSGKISTLHPTRFGGNVDNKNFVIGTSMYYNIEISGAGFYVGDSHFAQGDGELSGTAIEGSVNGRVQLILHKKLQIGKNPLLESSTHWETHGFGKTLDEATHQAAMEAIAFIINHYGLSRELAYSILSVKGDFHVTQVSNDILGVHCRILKSIFAKL